MTIEELEKFIKKHKDKIPKNAKIILSKDAEGNSYSELDEIALVGFDLYNNEIDEYSEDVAVVLWPIN